MESCAWARSGGVPLLAGWRFGAIVRKNALRLGFLSESLASQAVNEGVPFAWPYKFNGPKGLA